MNILEVFSTKKPARSHVSRSQARLCLEALETRMAPSSISGGGGIIIPDLTSLPTPTLMTAPSARSHRVDLTR